MLNVQCNVEMLFTLDEDIPVVALDQEDSVEEVLMASRKNVARVYKI